jgi:hypothetical protein
VNACVIVWVSEWFGCLMDESWGGLEDEWLDGRKNAYYE